MKKTALLIMIAFVAFVTTSVVHAGLHDKIQQRLKDSAVPNKIVGGQSIEKVPADYDKTYELVLNFLKKKGWDISVVDTSRENGQICTGYNIVGGWKQTGTRIIATLVKEEKDKTTVRISVTEQSRFKALTTEPWGDPKISVEKTSSLIKEIRPILVPEVATSATTPANGLAVANSKPQTR